MVSPISRIAAVAALLALGACGTDPGERALSGGAITGAAQQRRQLGSVLTLIGDKRFNLAFTGKAPVKTPAEYIAHARANPGKVNYATAGNGEISHLAGAWLHSLTGTRVTFVPFKGTGELVQAVIGKHLTGAMSYVPLALQQKSRIARPRSFFDPATDMWRIRTRMPYPRSGMAFGNDGRLIYMAGGEYLDNGRGRRTSPPPPPSRPYEGSGTSGRRVTRVNSQSTARHHSPGAS